MSTSPIAVVKTPPALNPVIASISQDTQAYAPAVADAVLQAEELGPNATGLQKFGAAITGVSQTLEANENPNVAEIAALVNLGVEFAHLFGVFTHKGAAAQPAAEPAGSK